MRRWIAGLAVVALTLEPGRTQAEWINIDWVTVGDAGNVNDTHGDGYGGVAHQYRIGKYEVTNWQYRQFLNAVAATNGDPNNLYDTDMAGYWGGIGRTGSGTAADPYVYLAKGGDSNWDSKPVNYVSWYDTLRFCNWLQNGQPTGAQVASTTEDGAYDMSLVSSVVRKAVAQFYLPSEDEWYKAAYYKGGGTSAGYWDYATQSDTVPKSEAPPGTDLLNGSANYYDSVNGYAVDWPYYMTDVGAYTAKPSESAYGTFDQTGNLGEWNETLIESSRGLRGGSWNTLACYLPASFRNLGEPDRNDILFGFRVASPVPEPSVIILLVTGALTWLVWRRKAQA